MYVTSEATRRGSTARASAVGGQPARVRRGPLLARASPAPVDGERRRPDGRVDPHRRHRDHHRSSRRGFAGGGLEVGDLRPLRPDNKVRQSHHQQASKAIVPLASGGQREWCQPQQVGNATRKEAIMASIFKAVTPASRSGSGSRSKTSGNSQSGNSGASTTTSNTD